MVPAIPNSILDSTKKMLGIDADYDAFDLDVITHINSTFSQLAQLGVGPDEGFQIEDSNALWADFLGTNKLLNFVKSYMYLKVRMWFDPPATSFDQTAKKEQISELEWRMNVAVDKGLTSPFPSLQDGWEEQIEEFIDDYLNDHAFADGFIHKQLSPQAYWSFTHPLGREPVVQVYVSGELVLADVTATDTTVSIQFPAPAVGVVVVS
jgi:hypothetical protein